MSQAIDIFHLPRGMALQSMAERAVCGTDGRPWTLRYPAASPNWLNTLAGELNAHRTRHLATMPVMRILDVIGQAVDLWMNPDFPLRRQAETLIPAITGYDATMVRIELKRYMRQFRRRELLRFLDGELDCPQALDEFRPNKAGGFTRLYGPQMSFQVFSSNVPGIPVWSMVMTLLTKGAILGKSSFSEPIMPALFARSLAMIDPDLADAIAVVPWKGGTAELDDAALAQADTIVVYGSQHTTDALRGKARCDQRLLSYGARVGFALIGKESLAADRYADTIHRMAMDVATYDQQSCLAPQTIFIEQGGALSPHEAAQLLGNELDAQQRKCPRSTPTDDEIMAIRRVRSAAQMQALMGSGAVLGPRHSTDWTVLYNELATPMNGSTAVTLPSPLNRTVNVIAVRNLEEALPALKPYRPWLQSCGMAVGPERLFTLAQVVGGYGIDRICPVGQMNRAKPGWHHDSGFNLLDLVHAVDIEQGTDLYSDRFDPDVE